MSTLRDDIVINASPERIFALYADVEKWREWDSSVAASSISGPFCAGTAGTLQPRKGVKAKILLTAVEDGRSFTVQSTLPLCTMTFEHELTPVQNATRVVHRVTFDGPLSFFFRWVIGNQLRKELPRMLLGLKHAAEQ